MMRKLLIALLLTSALTGASEAKTYKEMFGADPEVDPQYKAVLQSLDFRQGKVSLPGAHASLAIGQDYYYLNSADTAKVLSQIWGNPPSESGTLGMIFPAKFPPESSGSWGTVVEYSDEGYISDADAEQTDFDAVLSTLKDQTNEGNEERKKAGYDPITLVGWASPPYYDKATHSIHWARDLLFGTDANATHTLNYQLRVLGREGYLSMNFVAGMGQLQDVKTSIAGVTNLVQFDAQKKYEDYRDGDRVAAYGLAGLIAAGAGAKVAAKLGFLALALAFLKKGAVFVLLALGAIFRPIANFFKKNRNGTPPDASA